MFSRSCRVSRMLQHVLVVVVADHATWSNDLHIARVVV
jgi:hypothetical protein